ncbi:hypothetical protein [Methanospirillum lacunae]|uniref:Single Cache domain-containing protein n=1 Tax=Methanospirillum lacunae TaxID=668570 RepID=A0A2V2MTC0_9EURY|nr:hypothetical protein [Methanospirillum lacunae]PWR71444.1 hypothetical protein DK846_11305 [Methanospirillum lacunae]
MDTRFLVFSFLLILLFIPGSILAEDSAATSSNISSAVTTGAQEALMNLALDAKAYALENGKTTALSAFSDKATFVRNGMYISAYNQSGVLLSDPYRADKIGTSFITEEHDTGIVRQLKDLAQSGGGILTPEMTDTKGLTYYATDIDGGWWIVATSGNS